MVKGKESRPSKKIPDKSVPKEASKKSPGYDLDDGYNCPIQSVRDLSTENIKSSIAKSRYIQILITITIIGIILRFYNLGLNSLWLDEATTYNYAIKSLPEIWAATAGGEFNPPLFYWVEHFMLIFGNNEAILRLVPAIFGILTIPLVYLIGKEFFDKNVGIIAAAAVAFSPFLIYYSQEARAYSMMLFFIACAMVFYFRGLKTREIRDWTFFGIFSALAFWAHFYAFTIIAALFIYALVTLLPDIRKEIHALKMLLISGAIFVVLCLPLIIITLQLFVVRTSSAPTFGLQGADIVVQTFVEIFGFGQASTFILAGLFVIGIIQAFFIEKKKGIFLILITTLVFVISYFLSFKMPMQPRYLIFMSIILFVGIAISYQTFYKFLKNKAVVYGFIAVLFIISAPAISQYYSVYNKDDWRGLSALIQQSAEPGDQIILIPGYVSQPFNYYYSNATSHTFEYGASTGQDLEQLRLQKGNNTQIYLVTTDIMSANPSGDALVWLEGNATPIGQNGGIALFISR